MLSDLTAPNIADPASVLSLFEALALAAGAEIMNVREKGVTAETKADSSPVTEADRRAEALILEGLRWAFPAVPIVAEEESAAGRLPDIDKGTFFLVDPLDGTKEFVNGRTDFTVNIALVVSGEPIIGVVYAPARGRFWAGQPNKAESAPVENGTIGRREPMTCSHCPQIRRIVASKSHRTPETDAFITRFPDSETVSIGSSLKFCLLAEGAADLYPRFGRTMQWDTAAGDAVLRAAGGMTWTIDGMPLHYGHSPVFDNPHFIASGGNIPVSAFLATRDD